MPSTPLHPCSHIISWPLQDYTTKFDSFLSSFSFVVHTLFSRTPRLPFNFLSKASIKCQTNFHTQSPTRESPCAYAILQDPHNCPSNFLFSAELTSTYRTLLTLFFHWPLLRYNNISRIRRSMASGRSSAHALTLAVIASRVFG